MRSHSALGLSLLSALSMLTTSAVGAHAKGVTLQAFDFSGGSDGANPSAGLLAVAQNTAAGTTWAGGGTGCGGGGCGTVYQITTTGQETLLYSFQGGSDGANPSSELFVDSIGDVYGTTEYGGGMGCGGKGCGTIFIVTTSGQEQIVSFAGGSDGAFPIAGMVVPPNSQLAYGTTSAGGGKECHGAGCGTVFSVSSTGVESVVYAFKGGKDGIAPDAELIADKQGNLYGTTAYGGGKGCGGSGCGTVFKVSPSGKEKILYAFQGVNDGATPFAKLSFGANGSLLGTTFLGGANAAGTIFMLDAAGKEQILHSFAGGKDGSGPAAGVLTSTGGSKSIFGVTEMGGGTGCGGSGCGTIYKVDANDKETVLYAFTGLTDGAIPASDLLGSGKGGLAGKHGYLYGTAYEGGSGCTGSGGCGTVFTLKY